MKQHQSVWIAIAGLVLGLSQLLAGEPVDLLNGAKWEYSLDGGSTFVPGPIKIAAEQTTSFIARAQFVPADVPDLVALELQGVPAGRTNATFSLNGQKLVGPMPEMVYKTVPALKPSLLKPGQNVLTAEFNVNNTSAQNKKAEDITVAAEARLVALAGEHLVIQSGPIMGAADEQFYSFTCRTNVPAKVTVEAKGQPTLTSSDALFHSFRLPRSYSPAIFKAVAGQHTIEQAITAPAWSVAAMEFIMLGDSRTNPKDWGRVADAVAARKPQFVVVSGDLVAAGKDDISWDREFFGPGRELLSKTPTYAVIGNHEQNAPLFDTMFTTGGKQRNWSQQIGAVLLIGIDGAQDWTQESDNARWLEKLLTDASDAKFIFLACHYPAWSSSAHGKVDENAMPTEKPMLQMRTTVGPLLEKHHATAMFVGHDHTYERSETGGVTYITSGGAGAPRYGRSATGDKQNPHWVVYDPTLHYCHLSVSGDTCTMAVYTPDGLMVDKRVWQSRASGKPKSQVTPEPAMAR